MRGQIYLCTAASVLAMGLAAPAAAQHNAGDEAEAHNSGFTIEDIVVTARKRQESLQDIPLTISAFDAEKLEAAGITNVEQLTQFTPGWHFENAGSRQGSAPRIRGLDINTNNPTRQNASFFLDGVYYPGTVQSLDFNDIAQVEVIKGPQSAFFGRQTFGGAINFTTKDPADHVETHMSVTGASKGYFQASGSISVPLIEDKLFFRGSARYYSYEGPFRDSLTGERLGAQESRNFNASLIARPTDTLQIKLRYLNVKDDDGPIASAQFGLSDLNCGPFGTGTRKFFCGQLPVKDDFQLNTKVAPNRWNVEKFGFTRDSDLFSAVVDWDFADGYSLTASYAQYDDKNVDVIDADLTAQGLYGIATFQDFSDKSYEMRIASPDDKRLRWLIGGYYYDGYYSSNAVYSFGADFSTTPASQTPDVALVENLAVYGSFSYDILDNLTFSTELRWQSDEVTNIGGQALARRTLSGKSKSWLPRFILNWKPTRDIMAYAVFSQGNKPKQFNANLAGLNQTQLDYIAGEYGVGVALDEEKLDNFELGLKTKWMDGRMTANFAVYQMDWQDQVSRVQVFRSASDAATQTGQLDVAANSGSSRIRGLEIESSFAATPRLNMEASFALTNGKYTEFNSVAIEQVTGNAEARGNRAPRFPKYQASFGVTHRAPVDNDWTLVTRLDGSYMGRRYTDESNLAWMNAYATANARISAESDQFRFTLFVENLFDKKAIAAAQRYRDLTAGGTPFAFAYTLLTPRRVGVTAAVNF